MIFQKTSNKTVCHPRAGGDPVLVKDYRLTTDDQRLTTKKIVSRFSFFVSLLCLWSVAAFAATYDIKEMTPEIQAAISGRQARYAELQAAKQAGAIRETNDGLVSGAEPLASAENRDRLVIYQAIANQNNLGPDGLAIVQKTFAEVHQERG